MPRTVLASRRGRALRCRDLVCDGVIINQSELAHYGQISTTRMSQIMWLGNLAPDIQEQISESPGFIDRGVLRSAFGTSK